MRRARERGCGGSLPKQYRPIRGVPMVLRAVRPFLAHPEVGRVVLVLPAADAEAPPEFLAGLTGERLVLAPGGATRSDSVSAGLAELGGDSTVVLVHDGARPFVERDVIDAVIRHARQGESAIAAIPLSDTLKEPCLRTRLASRARSREMVSGEPRRHRVFLDTVLLEAYRRAASEGRAGTDDAEFVERMGVPVRIVTDSSRNLKITGPEDLALAELLAADSP